jgi:hypothetical protein
MFCDNVQGLVLQTQTNGFYTLVGSNLSKFTTDADSELANSSVYSSQLLSDGSYAIGTVSNGIFIVSSQGKMKYHTSEPRLSNNTHCLYLKMQKRTLQDS